MNNIYLYQALYRWYDHAHRVLPWRDTEDPYRIWISEIILQQTRVAQGMDYYLRFVERFPDARALAEANEDEVLRYWQGLGYYSRARNLHKAAKTIVERQWLPFPTTWEDIRQLPGVGDYTAGAIASFAYNLPYPAMDGNVYRVVARLCDCDMAFDTTQGKKHFHELISRLLDRDNPRLFNSAIMEFGALYCTPPLRTDEAQSVCPQCPLAAVCEAHAHHTAELLPVRKPRPGLRERYLNYYIYVARDTSTADSCRTFIRQRKAKDIWQHLYEFPLLESDHLQDKREAASLLHTDRFFTLDFTHILSHQRLHVRFFVIDTQQLPDTPNALSFPISASKNPSATSNNPALDGAFVVSLSDLGGYAFSRLTLRAMEKLHWL